MFKLIKQLTSLATVVAVLFAFTTETMAAKKSKTLKNTQKKGFVRCGVSQGLPGFSNADAAGNWTGVDVDVCRLGIGHADYRDFLHGLMRKNRFFDFARINVRAAGDVHVR